MHVWNPEEIGRAWQGTVTTMDVSGNVFCRYILVSTSFDMLALEAHQGHIQIFLSECIIFNYHKRQSNRWYVFWTWLSFDCPSRGSDINKISKSWLEEAIHPISCGRIGFVQSVFVYFTMRMSILLTSKGSRPPTTKPWSVASMHLSSVGWWHVRLALVGPGQPHTQWDTQWVGPHLNHKQHPEMLRPEGCADRGSVTFGDIQ